MKKLSAPKIALIVPLGSLLTAWLLFMGALIQALYERDAVSYAPVSGSGYTTPTQTLVHWSTYLFLAAIVAIAIGALWGQQIALRARVALGQENALARAAHRFTNLMVWIGLALGVVFVFGNFMSAFNDFSSRNSALYVRILGVYVPIVLATAMVVYVILRAFVFRADAAEHDHEDEAAKAAARARRRNLGLGYAVPILTTAFAIVLGLLIYDATKTALQTWVWVLIQAIVIGGIVGGTRFANRAKVGEVVVAQPRAMFASLAAGASNLNFILSVAFGAVVSIISISSTAQAVDKLYDYGVYDANGSMTSAAGVKPITLQWLWEEMTPAFALVLLVVVGTYLTITLRNRSASGNGDASGNGAAEKAASTEN